METQGRRAHGRRIRAAARQRFGGAERAPRFVRGRWIVLVSGPEGTRAFAARLEPGAVAFKGR